MIKLVLNSFTTFFSILELSVKFLDLVLLLSHHHFLTHELPADQSSGKWSISAFTILHVFFILHMFFCYLLPACWYLSCNGILPLYTGQSRGFSSKQKQEGQSYEVSLAAAAFVLFFFTDWVKKLRNIQKMPERRSQHK